MLRTRNVPCFLSFHNRSYRCTTGWYAPRQTRSSGQNWRNETIRRHQTANEADQAWFLVSGHALAHQSVVSIIRVKQISRRASRFELTWVSGPGGRGGGGGGGRWGKREPDTQVIFEQSLKRRASVAESFPRVFDCWLNFGPVQNSFKQVELKCKLPKGRATILIFLESWPNPPLPLELNLILT